MCKIVIIEDDADICNMIKKFLENNKYSVQYALNGIEGINLCKSFVPDLIILDIMLPRLNGDDVLQKLRKFTNAPVIVVSAKTMVQTKIELLKMGADDYVTKPFNVKHLFMRCNNLVNSRKLLQKKYAKQMDNNVDILATNSADHQFMEQCVACIEQNLDNPDFDVNMFAQAMNTGRTKLFLKIKGITGQTPNDFILNIRLKKAQMLLKQMDTKTVSEIAYEVGFNSPSYFIKRFRELFGVTPAQYQKGEE